MHHPDPHLHPVSSPEACEWRVKGEGAANLVFAYSGDDPNLRGVVLRVRKRNTAKASNADDEIWRGAIDWPEDPVEREVSYISQIMAPRLGADHVYPGVPTLLPDALRQLVGAAEGASPIALLLPDHTTFGTVPATHRPVGPAVCLEIKPKCGYLPAHEVSTSMEASSIKLQYPRFQLHMVMKHVKHKQQLSRYNPLDLFSGDAGRMQRALWSLVAVPSNNLRVFRDGALVYGGRPGGNESEAYDTPTIALADLHTGLQGFVDANASSSGASSQAGAAASSGPGGAREEPALQALVRLASTTLLKEGVLPRLLELQRLDTLGIEVIQRLFADNFLKPPPPAVTGVATDGVEVSVLASAVKEEWVDDSGRQVAAAEDRSITVVEQASGATPAAPGPSRAEALAALRDYLTATTAKDCGIMVTLQRAEPCAGDGTAAATGAGGQSTHSAASGGGLHFQQPEVRLLTDEATGCTYLYKVAFVDLDMKPASKIPKHWELDQELVECALGNGTVLAMLAEAEAITA